MNKKILISLSVIGAVAAIAIGGTIAYFSDTETSTGNTFTAGSLDLTVDSQCKYNGQVIPDCNWVNWRNLNSEKFFNFTDVKPGDSGEDTISLHVTNDSWACMKLTNIVSAENSCTEPESQVETGCDPNGAGELQGALAMQVWRDTDCNNELDANETVITSAQSGSDVIYPIADSQNGTKLEATDNNKTCVGVAWNVPSTVGNEIQSDSLSENVVFYAEQWRNNPNFRCVVPQPVVNVTDTWSVVDTDSNGGQSADLGGSQQQFEWFAKARSNNSGFEMAIGTDDGAPAGQSTADTNWVSGQQESFTLSYNGAGQATLAVANHPTVTYNVSSGTFGRIGIDVKAREVGQVTSVSNLVFSLGSLSPDNIAASQATVGLRSLTISGVDMSGAWTLTGNFTFTWTNPPSSAENQAVQFSID